MFAQIFEWARHRTALEVLTRFDDRVEQALVARVEGVDEPLEHLTKRPRPDEDQVGVGPSFEDAR